QDRLRARGEGGKGGPKARPGGIGRNRASIRRRSEPRHRREYCRSSLNPRPVRTGFTDLRSWPYPTKSERPESTPSARDGGAMALSARPRPEARGAGSPTTWDARHGPLDVSVGSVLATNVGQPCKLMVVRA